MARWGAASRSAVACFAKLWPVVLAPRLIVEGARRSRLAAVGAFAAVGALGLAGWLAFAGTDGPEQVLTFRGADGWQIESTLGSLVHTFGQGQARMEQGAMRIGVVPDVARVGLPLLGFALVGVVWWLAARARRDDAVVLDGLAPLAAVTATLVTATILSPQYVSWLLPFAAIAWVGGERTVGALTAVAGFLSTLGLDLVKELNQGDAFPAAVILARNLTLIALFVVAIARLARISASGAPRNGRRAGGIAGPRAPTGGSGPRYDHRQIPRPLWRTPCFSTRSKVLKISDGSPSTSSSRSRRRSGRS